jgi:hypothetical protein
MEPERTMALAVLEGTTGVQFAVPDGKHPGDLFFITDKDNAILIVLTWDGMGWVLQWQHVPVVEEYGI